MKFDFDALVSRDRTHSTKWNFAEETVGVKDALPMWVADMDFETAPAIKEAIVKRAQHGIYGYTTRPEEYFQSLIDWNLKRHGWKIKKEWITPNAGVVNALFNCICALTNPGDSVMIQPPVYHPFYYAIKKSDRSTVLNPLKFVENKYVPDLQNFEEKLKSSNVKAFILCNPHNPVGRVFTREELSAMGELCLKYNVLVISDEIHSDLIFKGYRHIPFTVVSQAFEENTIICTAPSKTFNLAGLSTSNLIIPNENLRKKYNAFCDKTNQKEYNIFGITACEAAYTHGEEWLDQLLEYIEANKKFAIEYIKSKISPLKVYDTEGTYFLWVDCRELGFDKDQLEKFMLHKGKLWFNQGYIFGTEGEGFVRINIACQKSILEEAMRRLESAVTAI